MVIEIGKLIGNIHKKGFIHGDLTSSNFIINEETQQLYIIDFGLSSVSKTLEDRAVDLYVLERALICTHYDADKLFDSIINGYTMVVDRPKEVVSHLNEVRLRGRKKDMSG